MVQLNWGGLTVYLQSITVLLLHPVGRLRARGSPEASLAAIQLVVTRVAEVVIVFEGFRAVESNSFLLGVSRKGTP